MKQLKYNIHLLYFSPSGTTKTILTTMAGELTSCAVHHDLTLPKDRESLPQFNQDDFLIIGLPVYAGRIPALMEPVLNQLSGANTPATIVAVYGNRDIDDALLEMKEIMTTRGFHPIAGAAFIGEHSFTPLVASNRPDATDLNVALDFGKSINTLLKTPDITSITLDVRGNHPYKERKSAPPLGPTITNLCNTCGRCVSLCPTGALTMKKDVQVDETLCILCHRCQNVCPENAITFGGRIPSIRKFLLENCTARKEPELFLGK